MWLDDFERRRPILEQFVELTAHVVCVSQGDPAGEIVLPDQGIPVFINQIYRHRQTDTSRGQ